jgi:hypothetical protein
VNRGYRKKTHQLRRALDVQGLWDVFFSVTGSPGKKRPRPDPRNAIAAQSAHGGTIMSQGITRSVFRGIHLVFSIPILGYIYSLFDKIPNYAPATRFIFVPLMILSGFWMWKGHVVRRLISKRSAGATGSYSTNRLTDE